MGDLALRGERPIFLDWLARPLVCLTFVSWNPIHEFVTIARMTRAVSLVGIEPVLTHHSGLF